jgi:ABC-type Mn2+/Zn2+ transport system ATPase subunit
LVSLREKVESLLDLFGLDEHRAVTFERLSTGLKQRLYLAKALINDPELLFLDGPLRASTRDGAPSGRRFSGSTGKPESPCS